MPPEAVSTDASEPRFTFQRLLVHRSIFEQIARPPHAEGETRPQSVPAGIHVTAKISLNIDTNQAAVTLDVTVTPDLKWQPYKIEYTISGIFAGAGLSNDQLLEFCKLAAPPILFPYVRESVHRMTMDGIDGPVKLDPINIQEMVNRTPWISEDTTKAEGDANAATEPPPPSSQ